MGNYWRYAFHCGSQTRSSFWVKPLLSYSRATQGFSVLFLHLSLFSSW
nr:MAG TPA: hypothetical protein [Caudoviricetes sp.]